MSDVDDLTTPVVVLFWPEAESTVDEWHPTIRSVVDALPEARLCGPARLAGVSSKVESLGAPNFQYAIAEASCDWSRHVLLVRSPVLVPDGVLDNALPAIEGDVRVASVSFLSNAAGGLSVPYRNQPSSHQIGAHDEVTITRMLRGAIPVGGLAPIALPVGAVTLLSRFALGAVGGAEVNLPGSAAFHLADVALQASRRGFLHLVDAGTFINRPFDLAPYYSDPVDDAGSVEYGHLRHRHPFGVHRYEAEKVSQDVPMATALRVASVKIRGLRVIVDGRDVGAKETGTQVQILSFVRELARRDDVADIQLGLAGGVPKYATPYLTSEKVRVFHAPDLMFAAAEPADIVHRPSQPSLHIPMARWRELAPRVVVTIQDLIAYQVGSYFESPKSWMQYRTDLREAVRDADGVVTISADTVRHLEREGLPIDHFRVWNVPSGTDHIRGDDEEAMPAELLRRRFGAADFAVVLGTNYGHKNRDLAIAAWQHARTRFPSLSLVLAGAFVPYGSSRLAESKAAQRGADGLFVLPDVTTPERNWLLRHARALLYPTSAEGFGLVPFEAARFGTPTVSVRFGPLADMDAGVPLWSPGWSPEELGDGLLQLLQDPDLCARQVAMAVKGGDGYTWATTAARHADVYRTVLSLPPRA